MRNKKLIPFEVIEEAVAGEPEAVDAVLRYYTAHIKYLSMYKGHKRARLYPTLCLFCTLFVSVNDKLVFINPYHRKPQGIRS